MLRSETFQTTLVHYTNSVHPFLDKYLTFLYRLMVFWIFLDSENCFVNTLQYKEYRVKGQVVKASDILCL